MKKLLFLLFLLPITAEAQTVRADRFTFNTGPCVLRSGSGTPEGVVTGNVCDTFWRTDTGIIYTKTSGSGNTGWTTTGLTGSGTANTVAKWTGTTALGNSTITDTGTTVTIAPSGDIVVNPTGNDVLPTTNYDINLGIPTLKFLSLSVGELIAETLVAQDVLATIGGRVIVAPTTLLTADLTNVATTIQVKHNNLASGDRVYLQASPSGTPQVEFMAVTSGAGGSAGAYTYSVTRNLDGSGANTWSAGDAVLNTGTTGDGLIDIYSTSGVLSGSGPTIVGNVRTGTTYSNIEPRWALGNLNGLYGYGVDTYGAVVGIPSSSRIMFDPTNGIRIYGSDNDEKLTIDMSGNAIFDGSLTVGTGRNQIRNSECRNSTDDWAIFENHSLSYTFSFGLSSFRLNDEVNTCYVTVSGTPAAATVTNMYNTVYHPTVIGNRYEASAYIGLHRATSAVITILWYDGSSSTPLSSSSGNTCTTASAGGTTLAGYCRSSVIATAPASAVRARIQIGTTHSGTPVTGTDPYTFVVRSYFGEAGSVQEDPTVWGPAGLTTINGGMLETDSVTARIIAAGTITATEIAANTITANEIATMQLSAISADLGTITAGSISAVTISSSTLSGNTITGGTININSSAFTVNSSGDLNANVGIIATATITDALINDDLDVLGTVTMDSLDLSGDTNAYVCSNAGVLYASNASCDGLAPSPAALFAQELQDLRNEVEMLKLALTALTPERRQ